jgi:hypothetical protein
MRAGTGAPPVGISAEQKALIYPIQARPTIEGEAVEVEPLDVPVILPLTKKVA